MKILFLTLNDEGGMIHYANQLIESFSCDSQIVFISGNIEYAFAKNVYKVKVSLKNRDLLKTILTIRAILEEEKPDIIHITSAHWYYFFLRYFIKKHSLVITLHDVKPHVGEESRLSNYLLKIMKGDADHLLVHGSIEKLDLINSGISEEKISIIPHGDYSFFLNFSDENVQEEEVVLFFGRIVKYKGLDYLLDAMKEIQKTHEIKLLIAGSGDLSPYHTKISKLDPRLVEIHNFFIPDSDVPKFFERAKIIVLPYIEASQTGIIPIAYAFRKLVIATSVGSIPEAVENGKTGILVRPGDSAALKTAIIDLINDKNKREIIAENGYLKMKNELSWDKIAKKMEKIYQKIITQRRIDENKFI